VRAVELHVAAVTPPFPAQTAVDAVYCNDTNVFPSVPSPWTAMTTALAPLVSENVWWRKRSAERRKMRGGEENAIGRTYAERGSQEIDQMMMHLWKG
jgi:hypothetical protein